MKDYVVFAFLAVVVLHMLLLYMQTRRPESLFSEQSPATRSETVLSGFLRAVTWPAVVAIALVALSEEPGEIMNFLRDPLNPAPPFVASLLMHPGKFAVVVVLIILRAMSLVALS